MVDTRRRGKQMNNHKCKQCNELKKNIDSLSKKIDIFKEEIIAKDNALSRYKRTHSFNIDKDRKLFIETVTAKGLIRTYQGYLIHESATHIIINILDKKGLYNYVIRKDMILGTRKVKKKDITGMKVFRGSVFKEWKQEVNE